MRRAARVWSFLLLGVFLSSELALGRDVDSKADLERLRGFGDDVRGKRDLEKERLSDVDEVKIKREAWEKQKNQALEEYKVERAKSKARLDETSPEFREDLKEKNDHNREQELSQKNFIEIRRRLRQEEGATITLTESHEFGLDSERERVDWKKRQFFAGTGNKKSGGPSGPSMPGPSSGRFSGSPGGSSGEMPPPEFMGSVPPPPPPDFYESEPPPPFTGDNMTPPPFDEAIPPPPPMFDEQEF